MHVDLLRYREVELDWTRFENQLASALYDCVYKPIDQSIKAVQLEINISC